MTSVFFALLIVASPPQEPQRSPLCRGVAVPSTEGRSNLILISVRGDVASLDRFKQAAEAVQNAFVIGPREVMGEMTVSVSFETAPHDPAGSTDPMEALRLLNRAEDGEFGFLTVRPLVMPIETLTKYGC